MLPLPTPRSRGATVGLQAEGGNQGPSREKRVERREKSGTLHLGEGLRGTMATARRESRKCVTRGGTNR